MALLTDAEAEQIKKRTEVDEDLILDGKRDIAVLLADREERTRLLRKAEKYLLQYLGIPRALLAEIREAIEGQP